jgi:hypothetical protein
MPRALTASIAAPGLVKGALAFCAAAMQGKLIILVPGENLQKSKRWKDDCGPSDPALREIAVTNPNCHRRFEAPVSVAMP